MVQQPKSTISYVGNVWIKMMTFENSGDIECGHQHLYDHTTLLAAGKLDVLVNKVVTTYTAPAMIFINKDMFHELVAKEDGTVAYCIHALREKDSDVILDPTSIPKGTALSRLFEHADALVRR